MADGTSVLLTYNVTGCEPMHEGAQILKTEGQISNTLNCLSIVLDTNSKTARKVNGVSLSCDTLTVLQAS